MLHIALHFMIPLWTARVFYRRHWRHATLIMLATMAVDADHLLANPVYDPNRCSIGFHPLHTLPAIVVYAALFTIPLCVDQAAERSGWRNTARGMHLLGLGLLIHMALDGMDCVL